MISDLKRGVFEAEAEHLPEIERLYGFLSENYRPNPAALEAALAHPATWVFGSRVSGRICGTATLSVRAVPSQGLVGYIDDVAVDPFYRGEGHAGDLVRHCLEEAHCRGCIRVELTCRPGRRPAQRLYRKLGFVRHKTNVYRIDL
jgi:ribosomal protein S18 acetylase RimI-like enzyme